MPIKDPVRQAASVRVARDKYNARNKAVVDAAKSKPCADCEAPFHVVCMDFDHRPGETKLFEVSRWRDHSIDEVIAEIAKCDVVCANCHRLRSFIQRNHGVAVAEGLTRAKLLRSKESH